MRFNDHSELTDKHAFLSPSNYHWINYNEQKLEARYHAARQAALGTELHLFAHKAIQLGIKQPKTKTTLNMYINDGIGFKMLVEQPLYYSPNCFGHADTISFRKGLLRIHDLKTGITQASHHQLEVYAALFCLEYVISPFEIGFELRIYQNNAIRSFEPAPEVISHIMDKIVMFDQQLEDLKEDTQW